MAHEGRQHQQARQLREFHGAIESQTQPRANAEYRFTGASSLQLLPGADWIWLNTGAAMKPRLFSSLLLFLVCTTVTLAADDPSSFEVPIERGSKSFPVISIYRDIGSWPIDDKQPQKVILCIWADGRAVWSQNRTNGGAPYVTAQIEPKRIAEVMRALDQKGLFERKVWFWHAIDSPFHEINILDGNRRVVLSASSMLYKSDQRKVPERITQVPDAIPFVRAQLESLLPPKGEPLLKFGYELKRVPK
ncbi:MAG: hypothetical protein AB1705_16930 [Verrucomicrobiota bacterium]